MTISKKPKLLATGHPDNFQTPQKALDDIMPYLNKRWLIKGGKIVSTPNNSTSTKGEQK